MPREEVSHENGSPFPLSPTASCVPLSRLRLAPERPADSVIDDQSAAWRLRNSDNTAGTVELF